MAYFRTFFRNAMSKFDQHPYAGNCLLGVTIGTAGDALAQACFPDTPVEASEGESPLIDFDWKRTASIGAYSAVVYPMLTRWYLWQEALCGATQGVGIVLAQKVAMDEFLLAPFFNGGYLSYAAMVSGENVTESLKENFWDVMFADWMVWPGVMVVCFLQVPVQFRPAYVAFVGVGWNTFLAYKAHSELTIVDPEAVLVQIPNDELLNEELIVAEKPEILVKDTLPLKMIRRTTTARRRE
jgi:hypothetical protein